MSRKTDDIMVFLILAFIVVMLVLLILQPQFEANAFNKFTDGPKATYWDALWTKLVVMPK